MSSKFRFPLLLICQHLPQKLFGHCMIKRYLAILWCATVACVGFFIQPNIVMTLLLHSGHHFACMCRTDAIIPRACGKQYRRIALTGRYFVEGGIALQPLQLFGNVRVSIFSNPLCAYKPAMVVGHIQKRSFA